MKRTFLIAAALLVAASLPGKSYAETIGFNFTGGGTSGTVQGTYGTATDAKYPQAFELTGISGVFSDSNIGITNAPIGSLVAITHDTPEPTNLLAPADFSRFAVASGLPAQSNGFLTYDNLYYPGGSPQTASSYPPHGGVLDIYGLMFNIGGGKVVDVWSNGDLSGNGTADYGVAVASASSAFDYVGGNVSLSASPSPTPEPATLLTLLAGLGVLGWWFRNRMPRPTPVTGA